MQNIKVLNLRKQKREAEKKLELLNKKLSLTTKKKEKLIANTDLLSELKNEPFNDETYQKFEKIMSHVGDEIELSPINDLFNIKKILSNSTIEFKTTRNYQTLMENALSCIHQLNELKHGHKNSANTLTDNIEETLKNAHIIFIGEPFSSGENYGYNRLEEIYEWISIDIVDGIKKIASIFKISPTPNELNFLLNKENKTNSLAEWLVRLASEHPFSMDKNKIIINKLIDLLTTHSQTLKIAFDKIKLIVDDVEYCSVLIEKYNFSYYEKISGSIMIVKDNYAAVDKLMNTDLIAYIEKNFLQKYQDIISNIKNNFFINDNSAPFALDFAMLINNVCKNLIDRLHAVKIDNDINQKNKIKSIKNKIINFYDETADLLKKTNKDRHVWLIDLQQLLDKAILNSNKFDNNMKQKISHFTNSLENFLKEYEKFYNLDNLNTKLSICFDKIKQIRCA